MAMKSDWQPENFTSDEETKDEVFDQDSKNWTKVVYYMRAGFPSVFSEPWTIRVMG